MDVKNKIKATAVRVRDHIGRNKVAYIAGGVAIGALTQLQINRKAFEAFLAAKGIDPMEFYLPEAFAELQS